MSVVSPVTVTVPASTANLGPGFDCIGAALTLYNQFKFTPLDSSLPEGVRITVTGTEAALVNVSPDNLVYQTFLKYYQYINQTPPSVAIEIELGVPLARGLGSSATAIVGGLVGANQLAGAPLSQIELMNLAIAIEGHPDNVVPALLGGCCLAAKRKDTNSWEICDISWHTELLPVLAIPNFELSTQAAREVLPNDYSRADAIFNIAHFGLLLRGLATGRGDWLKAALQDRIHQPYRKTLIAGYDAVGAAALAAGAYGMVISGAGPTLLALVPSSQAKAVVAAMTTAWQEEGVKAQVQTFSVDTQGTCLMSNE
ncbi:MAG: homoserine kinase [Symploca sp. SIO2C1]|nr:homoserine kinase [Symploca sp. SIO2C1]